VIRRDQDDLHIGDGHWLVAVVRHDKENRQKSVLRKIHGKDPSLFWPIVGIGRDADFLVAMEIVRGIVDGSFRHRLHKILRREHERHK